MKRSLHARSQSGRKTTGPLQACSRQSSDGSLASTTMAAAAIQADDSAFTQDELLRAVSKPMLCCPLALSECSELRSKLESDIAAIDHKLATYQEVGNARGAVSEWLKDAP